MKSEVLTALVGMPAVLITAAAGWMAGRVQSQGTYHGSVDAVRRAAQREAYADLFRAAGRFINAWESARAADLRACIGVRDPQSQPFPPDVLVLIEQIYDTHQSLEDAVDMVRLEGPEKLAKIADRIWAHSVSLTGGDFSPLLPRPEPILVRNDRSAEQHQSVLRAEGAFKAAHRELLSAARRYLNGGH
ncbi:hypothetical protein ACF1GY_35860 [Streptomyces sp. NPDC014684]|uniref:hypothetical protein n=1 Tax=Streptomyces sp. NPDC014684 TaxID=3364880 RepID=UPI0036F52994